MTVYLPATSVSTGMAVIEVPGGGYHQLAHLNTIGDRHDYYNKQGIAFAVLEYTLPNGNKDLPLNDAAAIKTLRDSSAVWYLDRKKIGIFGSSAGGLAVLYPASLSASAKVTELAANVP